MPDPSPSTPTVLNSNFLQLGRRSGGRPQRTVYPRRLPVSCDIAGIEPTTMLAYSRLHCVSKNGLTLQRYSSMIWIDFDDIWQKYPEGSRIESACFGFHVGLLVISLLSLKLHTEKTRACYALQSAVERAFSCST